jgi:hypothetical protein
MKGHRKANSSPDVGADLAVGLADDDAVQPLGPPGPCVAWHDGAQGVAVVQRQRLAVHQVGQQHVTPTLNTR